MGLTIAIYLFVSPFIRVLLPTFGLPTIDILTPSLAFWSCFELYKTCFNFVWILPILSFDF